MPGSTFAPVASIVMPSDPSFVPVGAIASEPGEFEVHLGAPAAEPDNAQVIVAGLFVAVAKPTMEVGVTAGSADCGNGSAAVVKPCVTGTPRVPDAFVMMIE